MDDTKTQRFKITLPIVKTSIKIVKDDKGNEVEERYVEGIASGTELDLHGDRMAPSAIESMAKSLKQHVIALNAEHDTSWLGELGDIDKLEISDNNDLGIKAKLNEMSSATDLWYALTKNNKKLGLSIGGYVKEYEMVKEGEGDKAKWVRLYKEIDLDHIAVTSSPAYPKSWVSNIAKSINNNKELLKKIEENEKEKSRRSQKNKKIRELARAIARSIQKLESDLLLELVYKGLHFCNEEQILLLERSLEMDKKDVSLEAEEAKKADAEVVDPKDEKDETSATPDNEESKDEESEEKEEETSEKEETETKSKDDESEDKSEEEGKDEEKEEDGEETSENEEETESEEDEEETSEEESEEKSTKADGELTKTIKELSEGLKEVLESNEKFAKRIAELEAQPADRKTVEVKKELGGEDATQEDVKELKKKRDEDIEEARKTYKNDPTLFARIQRIRAGYSEKLIKAIA